AELLLDVRLEPRLLAHLADGRRLGRLAGLEMSLRDGPEEQVPLDVAAGRQDDGEPAAPVVVHEPAGRELALDRRPRRGSLHGGRGAAAPGSEGREGADPAASGRASTSGTS